MVDYKKLDSFFNPSDPHANAKREMSFVNRHSQKVRFAKLLLPCIAAGLASLLVIIPNLKQNISELAIDITKPKTGELEKLHVENTVLYITDKDNKVHNFTAKNIDETEPGSKLIKISTPEGTMPMSLDAWLDIKSPIGFYNQEQNLLELSDGVELFYSEGMNMEIPDLFFDFKDSRGYSNSPITAQGFMGDLKSEGIEFFTKTGIVIFKGKTAISIREESLKK